MPLKGSDGTAPSLTSRTENWGRSFIVAAAASASKAEPLASASSRQLTSASCRFNPWRAEKAPDELPEPAASLNFSERFLPPGVTWNIVYVLTRRCGRTGRVGGDGASTVGSGQR